MSPIRPGRVSFPLAAVMKALVNTHCNDQSSVLLSIMCLCICTHTHTHWNMCIIPRWIKNQWKAIFLLDLVYAIDLFLRAQRRSCVQRWVDDLLTSIQGQRINTHCCCCRWDNGFTCHWTIRITGKLDRKWNHQRLKVTFRKLKT